MSQLQGRKLKPDLYAGRRRHTASGYGQPAVLADWPQFGRQSFRHPGGLDTR